MYFALGLFRIEGLWALRLCWRSRDGVVPSSGGLRTAHPTARMHGTQEPFSLLYQNTGRNSRGSWFSQSFDVSDTNLFYLVTSGEATVGGWWMGPDGKTFYLHDGAHFTSGSVPSWSFISKPIIQTKPSLGPASSQHALGASLQSLAQPCNARLHTSAEISSLLGTPYFTRAPAGRISSRRHDWLLFLRSPVLQQPGLGFLSCHPASSGLESHTDVWHHIWQLPCALNTKCIYLAPGLCGSFPLRTRFDQDVSMRSQAHRCTNRYTHRTFTDTSAWNWSWKKPLADI